MHEKPAQKTGFLFSENAEENRFYKTRCKTVLSTERMSALTP
jgi:hypothetical protein